jgi:hypothetical protein
LAPLRGNRQNRVDRSPRPWRLPQGPGYKPIGYGYESVAGITETIHRIANETAGLAPEVALARRRQLIGEVDPKGLIATPANSSINELVVEAARMSILHGAATARIVYGDYPHVEVSDGPPHPPAGLPQPRRREAGRSGLCALSVDDPSAGEDPARSR